MRKLYAVLLVVSVGESARRDAARSTKQRVHTTNRDPGVVGDLLNAKLGALKLQQNIFLDPAGMRY